MSKAKREREREKERKKESERDRARENCMDPIKRTFHPSLVALARCWSQARNARTLFSYLAKTWESFFPSSRPKLHLPPLSQSPFIQDLQTSTSGKTPHPFRSQKTKHLRALGGVRAVEGVSRNHLLELHVAWLFGKKAKNQRTAKINLARVNLDKFSEVSFICV